MTKSENTTVFRLENMFIKNLSLEIPENVVAPRFDRNKEPNIQIQMRNQSTPLDNKDYTEVILEATVKVKSGEDVQVLIEVTQSGIFYIKEEDDEKRQLLSGVLAPELLYPYVSQIVSDLMNKAGVPKIFLPPFNFKAIHDQKKRAMREQLANDKQTTQNA